MSATAEAPRLLRPPDLEDDRIYGLPTQWISVDGRLIDLGKVPEGPSGPDDPDLPEKTISYIQWAIELMIWRKQRIMATEGILEGVDPHKERAKELIRCSRDPAYFVATWCHTYEYRSSEISNFPWYRPEFQGWLPFIPMPYQVRMLRWMTRIYFNEYGTMNGAISKSRDVGATETATKWSLWGFLFLTPFHAKFVSRMGDLVDQPGNLDSMMERCASHLIDDPRNMALPGWMLPEGFTKDRNRKERLITHPSLRNMLSGEATTSRTGRGGRCSVIILDEYNFIKGLRAVLAACQATTGHLFGISSESVEENDDGITWREEMAAKDPDSVFVIEYWMHYFHDSDWLQTTRDKYGDDEYAFLREVMRQAEAGFGGWMYPEAREMQIIEETRNMFLDPSPAEVEHCHSDHAKMLWGIDPGINDNTALWFVMHDPLCKRDTLLKTWEFSNRESAEYIAAVLCGVDHDQDGRWTYRDPRTGDLLYDFYFPPRTQELMSWLRRTPEPEMIFGDPHGSNDHAGPDDGWFPRMIKFWRGHNPRGKRSYKIVINWAPDKRTYQGRRMAMKAWLVRLDFNNDPTAARGLEALKKSRWDDDPSKPRQTPQKTAKHDQWSDLRTAGEFIATGAEHLNEIELKQNRSGNQNRRSYDPKNNPRGPRKLDEGWES